MDPAASGPKADDEAGSRKTQSDGLVFGTGKSAALGAAEKRLVRKLDRHLIPLVMLLYLFSFLDR